MPCIKFGLLSFSFPCCYKRLYSENTDFKCKCDSYTHMLCTKEEKKAMWYFICNTLHEQYVCNISVCAVHVMYEYKFVWNLKDFRNFDTTIHLKMNSMSVSFHIFSQSTFFPLFFSFQFQVKKISKPKKEKMV